MSASTTITSTRSAPGSGSADRKWLWVSIVLFVAIAAAWVPSLGLALGDNHQGRIFGGHLLHVQNLIERGWVGSNFGADWDPYSVHPYAHHPPLTYFLSTGISIAQGEVSVLATRIYGYVGGLMTIGALAVLVRRITSSWLPVALSLAGLAVSGYFFFFGMGWGLFFPIAYFLAREVHEDSQARASLVFLFLFGMLAGFHAWSDGLVIGLLALYDLAKRKYSQALIGGIGTAVGLGLAFLWIELAAGLDSLFGHVEARAEAADYSIIEWIVRQGGFYLQYESIPVFILTAAGMFFGLKNERFRPLIGTALVALTLYTIVFHQNAWVHEYWNARSYLVLALGLGAIGARLTRVQLSKNAEKLLTLLLIASMVVPFIRLQGENYEDLYSVSSRAGDLIEDNPLPSEQSVAWYYGDMPGPRWYSWYTDRPVAKFHSGATFDPDAWVLVERAENDGLGDLEYVAEHEPYYLVRAGDLYEVLDDE